MKRFTAMLSDNKYINIPADSMKEDKENNQILVYDGGNLVACVDKSVILAAHISEREV
jgi:hypothetical protein